MFELNSLEAMMDKLVASVQTIVVEENDRKTMLQAIFEACNSTNSEIYVEGLALLVKVVTSSYHYLEEYMDIIVPITLKAIGSTDKRAHDHGIEFWKAVSQVEDPRDSVGRKLKKEPITSIYFAKRNLDKLIPVLFRELIRGELCSITADDFQHTNDAALQTDSIISKMKEVNLSSPSVHKDTSLNTLVKEEFSRKETVDCWIAPREIIIYFSELCENYPVAIECYVLPLVINELQHIDARHRYAALWSMLVFLKQIDPLYAENILPPLFPLVKEALRDMSSSKVRNVALWVVSWMFEKYPGLITSKTSHDLQQLIDDLIACLNDTEGRVAPSSCLALSSVSKAAYIMASLKMGQNIRPPTFAMSPYYKMIAHHLVKAANRRRRLTAAFGTLREVLVIAPDDCYGVVLETTNELLESLLKTIENSEGRGCHCYETLQNLLCGLLRSVVQTLKPGDAATIDLCHKFMDCLISLVTHFPAGLAREEALMAASTVAFQIGWELERHVNKLVPYLMTAICSFHKDDPGLPLAVTLVGNLFRALDMNATPHVHKLIGPLLALADRNRKQNLDVLIRCVATLGEMATAVGRPGFQIYMAAVLRRLQFCAEISTEDVEESIANKELREKLRQTCLETLSSLVHSILRRGSQPLTLELCSSSLCLKNIENLIQSVVRSKKRIPDGTHTAVAHLIGNLLLEFGPKKALNHIPLGVVECKTLLADAITRNTTSRAVESVCQAALFELEISGRELN